MANPIIVEKAWGTEEWLVNEPPSSAIHHGYGLVPANTGYCMKILRLAPNKRSSLHRHFIKQETFIVREGTCKLELGTRVSDMGAGQTVTIAPGSWHRFSNPYDVECVIWEVSTFHDDADVERLEPSGDVPR